MERGRGVIWLPTRQGTSTALPLVGPKTRVALADLAGLSTTSHHRRMVGWRVFPPDLTCTLGVLPAVLPAIAPAAERRSSNGIWGAVIGTSAAGPMATSCLGTEAWGYFPYRSSLMGVM